MTMTSRPSKVTSHQVAAFAGVSRSAVSRTFTPGASVSDATREKVLAAAAHLGYRPNVLASSLSTQKTRMIGMVMGEWDNPYYARMLRQFSERLQAESYHLLLLTSTAETDVDDSIRRLSQYQVDGVLAVSAIPSSNAINECVHSGTPMVLVSNSSPTRVVSSVNCDDAQVGRDTAKLLVDAGYERIAVVRGDPELQSNVERTKAIVATLKASGRAMVVADVTGCFGYNSGRRKIAELWQSDCRPDALICSSDATALGMLDGARLDLSIDVPNDMAIVGFGDTPQSEWEAYRLTSVRLPIEEMINLAVDDLLASIENPERKSHTIVTNARIVKRSTVRA